MDMWAMYFLEREGFETIQSDKGFVSYRIQGEECFANIIYVHPDHRHTGEAKHLADILVDVAKDKGCLFLTSNVYLGVNGASTSLLAQLKYGMEAVGATNNCIILRKEFYNGK